MRRKKKRLKRKVKRLFLLAIILIVAGITISVWPSFNKKSEPKKQKKEVKIEEKEKKLSVIAVGDALIHSTVYMDAKQSDGSYDFKPMLQYIKPIVKDYDLRYYNQETILGGTELGLSNYPMFNSPQEVGDAFMDAKFNLVSLATNHTMDKGETGVTKSVEYWSKQKKVVWDGQRTSAEEREKTRVYKKNGIKYAFFSYTTWTNGLETPVGKEYLNNVYSEEKAKADIEKVRDEVDIIIVAMHWGTEYSLDVSADQEKIAKYLSDLGVNVIIGAHPHVVEPVEYVGDTLVIYSLGNFISDQLGTERLTGLMFAFDITVKEKGEEKSIKVDNLRADLLYTKHNNAKNFRVYPYSELTNEILPNYMEYYNTYKGVVLSRNQDITFGSLRKE
ncbi:MAG: CapA family protein [Bacilli bacterium]|nr:CapA family protein [Bacilli bacterium]